MSRTFRNSHSRWWRGEESIRRQIGREKHWRNVGIRHWKTKKVDERTDEEIEIEVREREAKYRRDGRGGLTASGANKYFKYLSKKEIRRNNKKLCEEIVKSDYEDQAHPAIKDGKKFIWSVW